MCVCVKSKRTDWLAALPCYGYHEGIAGPVQNMVAIGNQDDLSV